MKEVFPRQVFGLCRDFYGVFSLESVKLGCYGADGGRRPTISTIKTTPTSRLLVDIIGTILHQALFIETTDEKRNDVLEGLYQEINSNFLVPRENSYDEEIVFRKSDIHSAIQFHLYQTALRQPEPLARTIFFYRVFENAHPSKGNRKNNLEYLFGEALCDDLWPVFVERVNHRTGLTHPVFQKMNYFKKLQQQSRQYILNSENQNLDKLFWRKGRSGSAHGGNVENIMMHDFSRDYGEAEKIAGCLELIAAYVVYRSNEQIFKKFEKAYSYSPKKI